MNVTAIDLNPLIVAMAPYVTALLMAFVGFGLNYVQKKTGMQPQLIDQLRRIANEGISNEANKLVAKAGQSGFTRIPVSSELISNSTNYVLANAGTIVSAAGYTPDKVAQLVTSLTVSHPAVDTPLNVVPITTLNPSVPPSVIPPTN